VTQPTGLPTDQARPMIRRLLNGELGPQEVRLGAVNRRGRTIEIRVIGSPLTRDGEGTIGAILVMDPVDPASAGAWPSHPSPTQP
jgi:two-component system, chemotaxis family, CheB/CheR fusion protein